MQPREHSSSTCIDPVALLPDVDDSMNARTSRVHPHYFWPCTCCPMPNQREMYHAVIRNVHGMEDKLLRMNEAPIQATTFNIRVKIICCSCVHRHAWRKYGEQGVWLPCVLDRRPQAIRSRKTIWPENRDFPRDLVKVFLLLNSDLNCLEIYFALCHALLITSGL
jgi:hypothetical protein